MLRNKGLLYTRKKQKHRRSKKKGGERFRITSKIRTGFKPVPIVHDKDETGNEKYDFPFSSTENLKFFYIQKGKKINLGKRENLFFTESPPDFNLKEWYPRKIYVGNIEQMKKDKIQKNQIKTFVLNKEYFYYKDNGQVELVKCTQADYEDKDKNPLLSPFITFDPRVKPADFRLYEKPQHGWLNHKENEKQMIPRPLDNNQQYDLNKYDDYYLIDPTKDIKLGKFITHQFIFGKKIVDFVNTNADLQTFSFFILPPKIVFDKKKDKDTDKKKEPEPKLDTNKTYFQIIKNTMIPLGTYKKMSGYKLFFENKTISKNASIHEKPEKKVKLDISLPSCGLNSLNYFWYDTDNMKYNLLGFFYNFNYKFDYNSKFSLGNRTNPYRKEMLNDRLYIKPVKPVIILTKNNSGTLIIKEYHGKELIENKGNYYYNKEDIDNNKPPVVFKLDSKLGYFYYDTRDKLIDLGKVQYDKKVKNFYFEYETSKKENTVKELVMKFEEIELFEKYNEHYLPLTNATPMVLPPAMKQHNE